MAINGFQFFQMLVSVICWGWFAYQAWMLFPVMRVHAISLLIMWNGMMAAQIMFQKQPNLSHRFQTLSDDGGYAVPPHRSALSCSFWKAVVEAARLVVEINHLHQDVRVMEEALAEHSLKVGLAMFGMWVLLIALSSWSACNTSPRTANQLWVPCRSLLTGLRRFHCSSSSCGILSGCWETRRRSTRVALDASLEMSGVKSSWFGKVGAFVPNVRAPSAQDERWW